MIFNSFSFLFIFLPITLLGYFLIGRKNITLAAAWLTAASLAFYGCWDYRYLPLLLGSIGFNYWSGRSIALAIELSAKQRWLAVSVITNLVLLGYFKYADFFIFSINNAIGVKIAELKVILPIGISFFTFTQIAFLVDTYQNKVKEFRFTHYCLFVTYFPHLIAGPVLHHKEMMPQFAEGKNYLLNALNIAIGLSIFTIGLTKKVLIADNLAPLVSPVFAVNAHPQFVEAWFGTLSYTFQLYFDFSGYSDMAIGLSYLMGVKLPVNFNSPYKAFNIIDFWQRWHMTLSRFLRDYLYIPLGGNRNGQLKRYRNLMLTMLLGGLWHGAGWTFVIWGGLHGFYLTINHAWRFLMMKLNKPLQPNAISGFITFFAVMVGWCFFRAPDIRTALDILAGLVGNNGISLPNAFSRFAAEFQALGLEPVFNGIRWVDFSSPGPAALGIAGLIAFVAPNTQEIFHRYDTCYETTASSPRSTMVLAWSPSILWALGIATLFVLCMLNMNRVSEFLYFQF